MAESLETRADSSEAPAALDFEMDMLDGKQVHLAEKYAGKVVLIVNVASRCGLTPQYKDLQAMHEKYGDQGLAIVGFPCNQFGRQEPGTADEIREFCEENYGVKFDMFAKIEVNGDGAADLYKYLTSQETKPKEAGKITWNFEKFLIDREGNLVGRYAPQTKPSEPELAGKIEELLKAK